METHEMIMLERRLTTLNELLFKLIEALELNNKKTDELIGAVETLTDAVYASNEATEEAVKPPNTRIKVV